MGRRPPGQRFFNQFTRFLRFVENDGELEKLKTRTAWSGCAGAKDLLGGEIAWPDHSDPVPLK
jgi:hypothetical protein